MSYIPNLIVCTPPMSAALVHAVEQGDLEAVRCFVEVDGVDVDGSGERGESPLIAALRAATNCLEVMKYLISKNAKPDATCLFGGETALMIASKGGRLEEVKLLLGEGHANVNFSPSCSGGVTALIEATRKRSGHSVVSTLLKFGANVNPPALSGTNPPLLNACKFAGVSDVVQLLLKHGADVHAKGEQDKHGKGRETAIHNAAWGSDEATVRLLIAYGADVNLFDEDDETPLYLAALRGDANIVQALLNHGANADVIFSDGCSVLHRAEDDVATVSTLVDHCRSTMSEVDYNSFLLKKDRGDNTALHLTNSPEIAKLLIEQPRRQDNQLLAVCRAQLVQENQYGSTPKETYHNDDSGLMVAYLETFESLVLTVYASSATETRNANDLIAVKLNPALNDFQRAVAQEALDLIVESTDMPDAIAHAMMGYLSPLDVMKRSS